MLVKKAATQNRGCNNIRGIASFIGACGMALVSSVAGSEEIKDQNSQAGHSIQLSPVVVSATREERPSFDLPVSIDALDAAQIQDGKAQVNLSESLARVPGIVVQNRQNYAQDLQISSRGYGARSTFGVRGVRLIADGIPASMPDGQGQAATFNLGSAKRIEVLRGPFSVLYGNSSGGVVQIFTGDGGARPMVTPQFSFGSDDSYRAAIKFSGTSGKLNYIGDLSRFETNGYREHSATVREHFNSKFSYVVGADSSLSLLTNLYSQPLAQDPLGLTAVQAATNPRDVDAVAIKFNTRKEIEQKQAGLVYASRLTDADTIRAMGYLGTRGVIQFQSIPTTPQAGPRHPGGVIDLAREYGGLDLRWRRNTLLAGEPFTFTVGVNYDQMQERRKGFQNFIGELLGVQGAMRRDEEKTVENFDQYVQVEWQVAPRWLVSVGLRHSEIKFKSKDAYIVTDNPDDSGSVAHANFSPVAGVVFRATPSMNLYASIGKGFETPTFNELAYTSNTGASTGLNLGLQPSNSKHYEAGIKAFVTQDTRANLAVFQADTHNEITVLSNVGGRSVFQNVGSTRRQGLEFSLDSVIAKNFNAYAAFTYLDAIYRDAFVSCTGTPCLEPSTPVLAGNRMPGIPRTTLYGELAWKDRASGMSAALEVRWNDKVYVNDTNSEAAGGYALMNATVGAEQKQGGWRFTEFLRIDNLFDRKYIGSVIVNDGNGRYYEPVSGRSYLFGVKASYEF